MSYSTTSISIMMIKNDSISDDTIRIYKNRVTNDFEITYIDYNDGNPITHKAYGMYRARVLEYVYMILKNQALDNEGYDSIQFNLPAMPRVIVSGSDFKDLYKREHFYELIGTGLDMLENCEKVDNFKTSASPFVFHTPINRLSNSTSRHISFDE